MKAIDKKLELLRNTIPHIDPREAMLMTKKGAIIIDVRELNEISDGFPLGAIHLQRGIVDLIIEDEISDYAQNILLICEAGVRALLVADVIKNLGYFNVSCVEGGFKKWKSDGLPCSLYKC